MCVHRVRACTQLLSCACWPHAWRAIAHLHPAWPQPHSVRTPPVTACPLPTHRVQTPPLDCLPNCLTECGASVDTGFRPERLLLFDKHPGGIGLAAAVSGRRRAPAVGASHLPHTPAVGSAPLPGVAPRLPAACCAGGGQPADRSRPPSCLPACLQAAPLFPELVRRALELVRGCGCSGPSGCPACVQQTECGEYNACEQQGVWFRLIWMTTKNGRNGCLCSSICT